MRILVDIDSTLSDTLPHWLEALNSKYGLKATVADITQWNMAKCPPLDVLTMGQILDVLHEPGFLDELPIMEGAAEALERMVKNGNEVYLATARSHPVSMASTMKWTAKHLPFLKYGSIVFTPSKQLIKGDVLIDDCAQHLQDYSQAWPNAKLLGISYPYNEHCTEASFVNYGPDAWDGLYSLLF